MSHLYYAVTLKDAPKYIFEGVDTNSDLICVPDFLVQPHGFLHRGLKFLLVGRVPLSGHLVEKITGNIGYQWLTTLKPGDRLLLSGVVNLNTLRAVKWLTPKGVRRYQYFNNCLRFVLPQDQVAHRVKEMKAMGYELMTFDPEDAKEYGMTYTPQFYRFPASGQEDICYDFFFCGMIKDRGERLNTLKNKLETNGYSCKFIVVDDSGKNSISYEQYLDYVRKSRCLVDMFQKGQVGLTRRPLEALFFDKKLLTENKQIADFDFYRKENTFIVGSDSWANINQFMNETDYVIVPDEVKQRYDVNQWLQYFK